MNLDLLMKLVRLANNNPNDNEANLAARKVCKLIAESEKELLALTGAQSTQTRQTRSAPKYSGFSNPYASNDWFNEFFKNPRTGQKHWAEGSWEVPKQEPPKSRPEVQKRKCVKCGNEVETKNINNVFVCNPCQWTEYTEKK